MEDVGLLQHQDEEASSNSSPSSSNPPSSTATAGSRNAVAAGDRSAPTAQPLASSLWSTVGGLMGYGRAAEGGLGGKESGGAMVAGEGDSAGKEERVHIFSLATGHLYERFLKVCVRAGCWRCQ